LPIPQTSPNRKIEKRNRDLQVALVKRHALIGMALTASQMTFASYDEAVALRDTLAQKLDAELDQIGTTDDDTLFSAVSHLERGHGIGHYRTGRKSRPNQTYFSSRTHTCPSDGL
jgi:hypothetical protein